jgi:hypothetical protein
MRSAPPPEARGSAELRGRLIAFLAGLDVPAVSGLTDETPLVSSGLFDSLALFRLVEWVERETERPVDPGSFDFVREWDTVPGILAYVERCRALPAGGDGG